MLCIRILVVSNIPGETDRATSSLEIEGATIVAKEVSGDAKGLARQSSDAFSSGNYDFMAVIADNPAAADIAFRKHDGITSTVCRDIDDAKNAREAEEVNAVVLKGSEDDIAGIIRAFAKGTGLAGSIKAKIPSAPKAVQHKTEEPRPAKRFEEHEAEVQRPRRAGVGGWIKDALGIMDDEPRGAKHSGESDGS